VGRFFIAREGGILASGAEVDAASVVWCDFAHNPARKNTGKQPCHKSEFGTILVG
jgi:hypothetical protein